MKQNRLENTAKEMYKERDFYNNLGYPGSKGKRLTIVPKENMFGQTTEFILDIGKIVNFMGKDN